MARRVSCTCTVGEGSERHNHDLDYRQTLEHVHGGPEDVVELVPYRPYKEQINEIMYPYIKAYNDEVDARFEAAKQRYKEGKIKSRPKRRDYQHMDYDYYEAHLHDTKKNPITKKLEEVPMWRSIIFGLGDQADKENGVITKDEAVRVMSKLVKDWPELFRNFKLLGATIHLDEQGFYHCHIDYKPVYEKSDLREVRELEDAEVSGSGKKTRGLSVGVGHEATLAAMGYEPEQSIINESDKAPIRFNAFRNRIYRETEVNLNSEGLRLLYKATEKKEPGKDSSKNQSLENWQASQDAQRDLQERKNQLLDIIEKDDVAPEDLKKVLTTVTQIDQKMTEIEQSPKSRLDRRKRVVEFRLLDQLKSFVRDLVDTVQSALAQIRSLEAQLQRQREEKERLRQKLQEQEYENIELRRKNAELQKENARLKAELAMGKGERELRDEQLASYKEMEKECPIEWAALMNAFKVRKREKLMADIEWMEDVWKDKNHFARTTTFNGYTRFRVSGESLNATEFMNRYMELCDKAQVPADMQMEAWYDRQRARARGWEPSGR